MTVSPEIAALAAGDFSAAAAKFASAGFSVTLPAPGLLQIAQPAPSSQSLSLLLSVGVHGDETAPIELLAGLLVRLLQEPQSLQVNLLIVVGNLAAIAEARRFIEADLNRLFRREQGELTRTAEGLRAAAIMAASSAFFATARGPRWHLDLHTAIRASVYPTFAIVPAAIAPAQRLQLHRVLGHAEIAATILNPTAAGTYSAFSAEQCGATSATVELGQVSQLGENETQHFDATGRTLAALLRCGDIPALAPPRLPLEFVVAQEIIKHTAAFKMSFDGATQNFTPLAAGSVIATDGDVVYRVGAREECVVFPNPSVRAGLRAGLMVVRLAPV